MQPILVIDTALEACSVGLVSGDDILWQETRPMTRGHQEALGPMVAQALGDNHLKPKNLSRIAVTIGPGSFTGLRIGLSFAKGLSVGADVPLVGLGTLEALAADKALRGKDRLAVIDGGRGQIFMQYVNADQSSAPPLSLLAAEPDRIKAALASMALACGERIAFITGPATDLVSPYLAGAAIVPQATASIEAMAWLAQNAEAPFDLKPLYMREADATPSTKPVLTLR
jgi:tRNA threonylcarbamoyladenosine biosynthesis protein TsaB